MKMIQPVILKQSIHIMALIVGILTISSVAQAQDGRDDNRRWERERRSWDPTDYLRRIDSNRNGKMDPGELQGRMRDYVRNLGFNPDKTISISDIVKKSKGDSRDDRSRSREESSRKTFVRKVPGFGVEMEESQSGVSNFSSDGSTNNPVSLRRKYGESIMREVERSLDRYDRNRDGKLDANEIRNGRWGRPSPQESDLNKDGQLSTYELAERYKQRNSANNGEQSSRDRNDDRRSDNRSSGTSNASDARARAREAAEKAARERESKARDVQRERDREDTRDSNARARARAAAEAAAARRDRDKDRTADFASRRDSYEVFAKGTIEKHDKNKDGVLDRNELKNLRNAPDNLDADKNGKVTYEEILNAYKSKNSRSSSGSRSSRYSDRGKSSSSRGSRSFSENDSDGDGKIKMVEYTDKWTQEKISEFQKLDRNNDGMLSQDEFNARESDRDR